MKIPFETKRYVGFIDGGVALPFSHYSTNGYQFFFDVSDRQAIKFVHANGRIDPAGHSYERIMTEKTWGFLTEEVFQKYFPALYAERYAKAKTFAIRGGALYFNNTTLRVERVILVQDRVMVWSSFHKSHCTPYPRSVFRLATKDEVKTYLDAVNE